MNLASWISRHMDNRRELYVRYSVESTEQIPRDKWIENGCFPCSDLSERQTCTLSLESLGELGSLPVSDMGKKIFEFHRCPIGTTRKFRHMFSDRSDTVGPRSYDTVFVWCFVECDKHMSALKRNQFIVLHKSLHRPADIEIDVYKDLLQSLNDIFLPSVIFTNLIGEQFDYQ